MSAANYLGNRFLSRLASTVYRREISDVCTGMWAFRADILQLIDLTADGFDLEANFFAECAKRNVPIKEIPITYKKRIGTQKLRLSEGLRIALALLKRKIEVGPHERE